MIILNPSVFCFQEISNRTHGPRTPKPEYLNISIAPYWTGSLGIRSHSIFHGLFDSPFAKPLNVEASWIVAMQQLYFGVFSWWSRLAWLMDDGWLGGETWVEHTFYAPTFGKTLKNCCFFLSELFVFLYLLIYFYIYIYTLILLYVYIVY